MDATDTDIRAAVQRFLEAGTEEALEVLVRTLHWASAEDKAAVLRGGKVMQRWAEVVG